LYELSQFDNELRETLTDEPTINRILLKSKLLFRLMRCGKLVSLHVMKINLYDKEKAFRVCKSSFLISENKSSFEEDFKFILSIDSVKELEKRADVWAYHYINNHKALDYYTQKLSLSS
jgi:hypothetical protein